MAECFHPSLGYVGYWSLHRFLGALAGLAIVGMVVVRTPVKALTVKGWAALSRV